MQVLLDFESLPQLLVVKGEIQGLKAFLGPDFPMDPDSDESQSKVSLPLPPCLLPSLSQDSLEAKLGTWLHSIAFQDAGGPSSANFTPPLSAPTA